MAPVLKTGGAQALAGSNPAPSARSPAFAPFYLSAGQIFPDLSPLSAAERARTRVDGRFDAGEMVNTLESRKAAAAA
jgi:hypothetical protein